MDNPFWITPRISTPINVPAIEPFPPDKLAPPITTAAIAVSSYNCPAWGCAEFRVPTSSIEAIPHIKALKT